MKRAFEPGCPFQHILIFKGEQDVGKSTFFRILASDDFFYDGPLDITSRDDLMKLAENWIVEMAELASFQSRRDEDIKRFITTLRDDYRKPYDVGITRVPRPCIFGGNTNKSEFLPDETGNRRYWVVDVGNSRFDLTRLQVERDQILAEAVFLYRAAYSIELSAEEKLLSKEINRTFEPEHPWYDRIKEFTDNKNSTTLAEVMQWLGISLERQDTKSAHTVGKVLRLLHFDKASNGKNKFWKRTTPLPCPAIDAGDCVETAPTATSSRAPDKGSKAKLRTLDDFDFNFDDAEVPSGIF